MNLFVVANFVQACCWQVCRLPIAGETLAAESYAMELGGKGLNVAIAARRLGHDVSALLACGRDTAGDALLRLLRTEGISQDFVYRFDAPSGCGAGIIAKDGGNLIAVYPGANLLLDASHADLTIEAIQHADVVYGHFETSLSAVQRSFELARSANRITVLNPSPWQAIPAALLDVCDVLIVNQTEAQALLKTDIDLRSGLQQCAHQLQTRLHVFCAHWKGHLLVVTLGEAGAIAFPSDGEAIARPAWPVKALDTIGAGDAFSAGLLTGLAAKSDLAETLDFANACGAILASQAGVLAALPNQAEVARFRASFRF